MASKALVDCPEGLRPVRLLREEETVRVHYLDTNVEFHLDPERPVEILQTITANDDSTAVEVCASNVLAVRQMTEGGEVQTVMLSPPMALELARLLNSFIFFPIGLNAE